MATYTVRIEAPKSLPIILSNGNVLTRGNCDDEALHYAQWHDPHPKPTYLFALVVGDLASVHDSFTTGEGRNVSLGIYVEKGKQDRCAWAMECLKASMRWDERRFGLFYDLDVFNIVAVSDFNMGAMENKGLNIFNDKYILARPDTATDTDYVNIERIVAHEYFHNWTGNRITCRDWFQLCLKEGLTVFRDQEFTADLRSRGVKRIEDVKTLRARQFPEDQGPLAHAVRPSSYIEINNFYTPTIYEKGAEICRMLHTLLGEEIFRAAIDLYFERHDGEAATVENFLQCMADMSGRDLSHFSKWYEVAGTPVVTVNSEYDADSKKFKLQLSQQTPDTPQQANKPALHIPISFALLAQDGTHLPLPPQENVKFADGLFEFNSSTATLTFPDIGERPLLSINRNFSAPIILRSDASEDDLLLRMAIDNDNFNRWEAAQASAMRLFTEAYNGTPTNAAKFAHGLVATLSDESLDNAFKALMLQLPGEAEITVAIGAGVDANRIHACRYEVTNKISTIMQDELQGLLQTSSNTGPYSADPQNTGWRSLWLAALSLLSFANPTLALGLAQTAFMKAANMTIELGSISSVMHIKNVQVEKMLATFYQRHSDDHLLVDKWFMLQAARANSALDIEVLINHPDFTFKTPNRVYALVGSFTGSNLQAFHASDGTGYQLLGESIVTLNAVNPQVAARMANGFRSWGRYDEARKTHSRVAMEKILKHHGLSNDVYEIISRTLNG